MTDSTTIKLSKKTKERLDRLREYKNESYEEVIVKILDIFNLYRVNPGEAVARLALLEQQRKRIFGA